MTEKTFGKGAVVGRPDPRDFTLKEVAGDTAPFDWNVGYDVEKVLSTVLGTPFKIPVKNQGSSGSCGGQAWSYYAGVLETISSGSFEERSAKFIYSQTFVTGGGSAARDNAEILRKQGVGYEAETVSYEHGLPPSEAFMERPQDITDRARIDAKGAITAFYASPDISVDSIAKATRDFHGTVIGVSGQDNGTWLSKFPKPPTSQNDVQWRHWLYVGKAVVIDGKKYLTVLNSWGVSTGELGWQYLGEEYIPYIWSATTHILPVSTPPTSFKHTFGYDLKYGSKGAEVVALQTAMQALGYFPKGLPCSGNYLDITRKAVLDMQVKEHIGSLSEITTLGGRLMGAKTRAFLNSKFAK